MKLLQEQFDRFLVLAKEDRRSASQMARELGVSVTTVIEWAVREGIVLPTKAEAVRMSWADPDVRAKRFALYDNPEFRERMREASRKSTGTARDGARIEVPAWVPADLRREFLEIALTDGEEAAASACRKLKREMQLAEAGR